MPKRIRLSPRIQVREADGASGSYPTNSRSFTNRTGRSRVFFDDTRTIVFQSNVSINYPSLLRNSSQFLTSDITSSLSSTGTVKKGISDEFVTFNDIVEQLTAFDESRHIEQSRQDPFYTTGSSYEKLGVSFSSRLASKMKIEISLNPIASSTFGMHYAGVYSGSSLPSYQMMYFNHQNKTWEGVFQGRKMDYGQHPSGNLPTQASGFGPSVDFIDEAAATAPIAILNAGRPTDLFGFPFDARYHATSSQVYLLSGVIDCPFVLEKIVCEFSATLQMPITGSTGTRLPITTFFLLNQRTPAQLLVQRLATSVNATTAVTHSLPQTIQLTSGSSAVTTRVDTIRDLVTYMQVTTMDDSFVSTYPGSVQYAKRDLTISGSLTNDLLSWSGKYAMSASCRAPAFSSVAFQRFVGGSSSNDLVNAGWMGGRSGLGSPTGRSLLNDIDGNEVSSSITLPTAGTFNVALSQSQENPYILFPNDRLVFGWELPDGVLKPQSDPGYRFTMHPGAGKVVLYGSMLRNNEAFQVGLNQLLTTDDVHEMLFDGDIVDQFATELAMQFSGTYRSDYVTGSLTTSAGSRRVLSSALFTGSVDDIFGLTLTNGAENRARLPGFARWSVHASENERYYDTLMPRIDKIVQLNGSAVYFHGSYNHVILGLDKYYSNGGTDSLGAFVTASLGTAYPDIIADATWDRSFPYEPRYSSVERNVDVITNTQATRKIGGGDFGTILAKPVFSKLKVARAVNWSESVNPTFPIWYLSDPNGTNTNGSFPSSRNVLLHLYGIGAYESGTMAYVPHWSSRSLAVPFPDEIVMGAIFRGFKYGVLNALPEFSKSVFRATHYGHVRDMLEQRYDSKFYDTIGLSLDGTKNGRPGATSSPVQVKFVQPRTNIIVKPTKTFSSNLSIEATSSMPYFDGHVKNREEPLDETQLNSIDVVF